MKGIFDLKVGLLFHFMFTLFVRFYYMFHLSLRLTIEVFLVKKKKKKTKTKREAGRKLDTWRLLDLIDLCSGKQPW